MSGGVLAHACGHEKACSLNMQRLILVWMLLKWRSWRAFSVVVALTACFTLNSCIGHLMPCVCSHLYVVSCTGVLILAATAGAAARTTSAAAATAGWPAAETSQPITGSSIRIRDSFKRQLLEWAASQAAAAAALDTRQLSNGAGMRTAAVRMFRTEAAPAAYKLHKSAAAQLAAGHGATSKSGGGGLLLSVELCVYDTTGPGTLCDVEANPKTDKLRRYVLGTLAPYLQHCGVAAQMTTAISSCKVRCGW